MKPPQDIVFSDEEGSGSGRSEGEEEGAAGGYFPSAAFPGGFPAPPAPPPALLSPPASASASTPAPVPVPVPAPAPHVNGHPQHHEETVRHVATALQGELFACEFLSHYFRSLILWFHSIYKLFLISNMFLFF